LSCDTLSEVPVLGGMAMPTSGDIGSEDHEVRVISVYATPWRFMGELDPEAEHLSLGQLEEFYALYRDQLPQILLREEHDAQALAFEPLNEQEAREKGDRIRPIDDGVEITSMQSWLFVLPSDQIVAAIDFELRSYSMRRGEDSVIDPLPTIRLLERCAYARLNIGGRTLEDHISALAQGNGAVEVLRARADGSVPSAAEPFPPERHQIVFATKIGAPPLQPPGTPGAAGRGDQASSEVDDETIQRILYRVEPPNRPEFVEYQRPPGLNHKGTLCAVTPYVSLLSDHPDYLENSVFLTVVQAIGTAARFRQIWHRAYGEVRGFRREGQAESSGTQKRDGLERLADELGNLELDLSFMVETSGDLGLLIPSLRIGSFYRELYNALELRQRAATVSRMFTRLEASIRSELTAIEIRDQRREEEKQRKAEDRRLRWALSVGFVSFLTIPLGFLAAFFGLNAAQVNANWSIFDMRHYRVVYMFAGVLMLLPITTWVALGYIVARRRAGRWPFRPEMPPVVRQRPAELQTPTPTPTLTPAAVWGPDDEDESWRPPALGPNRRPARRPDRGISGRVPKQPTSADGEQASGSARAPGSGQAVERSNAAQGGRRGAAE
jgi:hypothetical protein